MSTIRFTLEDGDGITTFGTEKVENWDSIEASLVRSESYRGVVRKLTNSFSFVHDIKQRLYRSADMYGTNAYTSFIIEVGNDNRDAFSYTPLGDGFPMVADFATLSRKELVGEINFVDSSFSNKITTGEKEKINLTTLVGLDGEAVTDYTTLLKTIYLPDRTLELNSELAFDDDLLIAEGERYALVGTDSYFLAIPTKVTYNPDENYKSVFLDMTRYQGDVPLYFSYYLESDSAKTITQTINANFRFSRLSSQNCVYYVTRRQIDADGNLKGDLETVQTGVIPDFTPTELTPHDGWYASVDYQKTETIEIAEGDSLQFYISFVVTKEGDPLGSDIGIIGNVFFDGYLEEEKGLNTVSITSNSVSYFDATTSNCILPHEYFTQMIEVITGNKNAFYSNYFGRTDLGYDEDGEGAYLALQDGHMLRNLPIEENPFNSKFKDILENYIKTKNLVAGIEYKGDIEVFRIEKYGYVFGTGSEVLNFGEAIADVEMSVNSDLTYGSVKVGYDDIELDNLNGLNVIHGEVNYSTPLTIDNELDLVTNWIAESYAIEQTRREQYASNPDGDTQNDKDIFIIEAMKYTGTAELIPIRGIDYESVTGILSPSLAYNLGITPARMLREWGAVVNGCLQELNNVGSLVLTKSASNNGLVSKKVDESEVVEGDSIPINILDSPLMLNKTWLIGDLPITKTQWDLIEQYPNGLFKFVSNGTDVFFYIELATNNIAEMKGSFKGTQANM